AYGPDGDDVPREGRKLALPPYIIEPPDVLLIEFTRREAPRPLRGEFLVGPDGTVNLGTYGQVRVGGVTVPQARDAIAAALEANNIEPLKIKEGPRKGEKIPLRDEVIVDIVAYNSKFYYVITDGGGYGASVFRIPVNGTDTVLDALARIGGLPNVASKKKIWVARANLGHPNNEQILPVDWCGLAERGEKSTNYQLVAGDRVFVHSDVRIRTYNWLDKTLNPVDRVFRSVLLGSTTVNSIRQRTGGGGGGTGAVAPAAFIPVGAGGPPQ